MKLTKDECRILAEALNEAKYAMNRTDIPGLFPALEVLEYKLSQAGKDNRRNGRTSQNDWTDCLKRFAKTNKS